MHRQHVMCTLGRGMLTSSGCVRGEVLVGMRCEREDAATVILDLFERVGRRGARVAVGKAFSSSRCAALVGGWHPAHEDNHGGGGGVRERELHRAGAGEGSPGRAVVSSLRCRLQIMGVRATAACQQAETVTCISASTSISRRLKRCRAGREEIIKQAAAARPTPSPPSPDLPPPPSTIPTQWGVSRLEAASVRVRARVVDVTGARHQP